MLKIALYFAIHCKRCQKANGSAFTSSISVRADDFKITKGQEFIKAYKTVDGISRYFCVECGSPLFGKKDHVPEIIRLRLGTLDTSLEGKHKPQAHIFTAFKAQWDHISDDLPQHDEWPK